MRVQLVVYFIHPLWCYIFTQLFELELSGIGLARCFSEFTGVVILFLAMKHYKLCPELWDFKYSMKIMFSEWIPFLRIAIPSGCITFLEWVFFEIQTIIVGMINDDTGLAAQTAFQSITMFFFMCPLGLSFTVNSYLGKEIDISLAYPLPFSS